MLDEPLIPVDLDRGRERVTLPGLLAALACDAVAGFPGLLAHQRHGWFLFLAQLGAIALHRAGLTAAPVDEAAWRRLLLAFSDDRLEPWQLVVADPTSPALLQPPIACGGLQGYALLAHEPDGIDVLVTAKAHDVKPRRVGTPEPHHWLYALVTLQTLQGYSGKLNYGIARMNGGFASRPLVELTLSPRWGRRLLRALEVARQARAGILDRHPDYFHGDLALLWLRSWDEEESLSLRDLDPFFIEICRRVRLVRGPDGRLAAWSRTSTVPRIAAKATLGNLGDPWLPIGTDGKALTVSGSGFHYGLVVELLDEASYLRMPALQPLVGDPEEDAWLHLAVLVRGQGETQGLHERWLPVPGVKGGGGFMGTLAAPRLGEIGKLMIEDARNARGALRAALAVYLQGGPDEKQKLDRRDKRARDATDALDQRIDHDLFFQCLWQLVERAEDDDAYEQRLAAWRARLARFVRSAFEEAVAALPAPQSRHERARAKAELMLNALLGKHRLVHVKEQERAA